MSQSDSLGQSVWRRGWIGFRFGRWMVAIWPFRPEVLIDRFNYPAFGVLVSRSEKPLSTATEKGMTP